MDIGDLNGFLQSNMVKTTVFGTAFHVYLKPIKFNESFLFFLSSIKSEGKQIFLPLFLKFVDQALKE